MILQHRLLHQWLKYMDKIRRYEHGNTMVFIDQIKKTSGTLKP